jgi:hypothetical protein
MTDNDNQSIYEKDGLEALGRIQGVETRKIILNTLSVCADLEVKDVAILAEIIRDITYIATRTYEGKRILTGIVIGEKNRVEMEVDEYFLKFVKPIPYPSAKSQLESISMLANGKNSLIAMDYSGNIYGVLNTAKVEYTPGIDFGGFVVHTNRHGETFLTDLNGYIVCFHDGFEWKLGTYNGSDDQGATDSINEWRSENRECSTEDHFNWYSFVGIVQSLSERRLSSLFAICDEKFIFHFRNSGVLSSLRPELDDIVWGRIKENTHSYTNLFKLDGIHILSRDLRIIAVCQIIKVPTSGKSPDSGAGRSAARYLSSVLGDSGRVIKVSSDGPVSVFSNGKHISKWPEGDSKESPNISLPLDVATPRD